MKAVEDKSGLEAKNHTHTGYHKRKKKFIVCKFTKSDDGIYGTEMNGIEYDRKGLVNLIIEISGD